VVVAIVAGVNPARLAPALPRGERTPNERTWVAGLGALAAGVVLAVMALGGDTFADALDVSAPTMTVAAGLVLAIAAVGQAVRAPRPEPALDRRRAALVPVMVPFVLRPEVGVLCLAAGAADQVGAALVGLLVAAGLVALSGHADVEGITGRVLQWSARVGQAAALVAGIALTVDGVSAV
jgi:small neutral amino acid transporter SnatA (MarC family)